MIYTQKEKLLEVEINVQDLIDYKDTIMTVKGKAFPVEIWKSDSILITGKPKLELLHIGIKNNYKPAYVYIAQCKEPNEINEYPFCEIYVNEKQTKVIGISFH